MYGGEKKPRKLKIRKQCEDKTNLKKKNLFILKTENEAIKGKMIRDIKTFFEQEEKYYKSVRVGDFWSI